MLFLFLLRLDVAMWIIEVISRVAKGVNLEFHKQVLRQFLEQPVQDKSSFNAALRVKDKHNFGILGAIKFLLKDLIGQPNIAGCIAKIPLNEAFYHVKNDACSAIMYTENGPLKGESQAIDVTLQPGLTGTFMLVTVSRLVDAP